jgi:hypothetical protein
VLGFTPPEPAHGGKPRKSEVKTNQTGFTVRARKAYSPPKADTPPDSAPGER